MKADLIVKHLSQLVTVHGENRLRQGEAMQQAEIIEDGFVAVTDGIFTAYGRGEDYLDYADSHTEVIDGNGLVLTPGLVDSHTHLVHYGSREHEFAQKLAGVPYLEILKQGGGILNTVESTRKAGFDDLYDKAKKSLDLMLLHGVTSIEAKSGYGLDQHTELLQLSVANALNSSHPIDIKSTFLGAHAIPKEFQHDRTGYMILLLTVMDKVKEQGLADYCDVFCEKDVFSLSEARFILLEAKKRGFKLKIHADEIEALGGVRLACELGAVSCDHLVTTIESDMELLAKHHIASTLLPATSFNLNKDFARARLMIEHGCGIAIATDYNPGSAPSENLQLSMSLSALKMKMTPQEVITAVTINAACAINREDEIGSVSIGKKADFILFDVPNLDYILYHFGINHVRDVYKNGIAAVKNQKLIYEVNL